MTEPLKNPYHKFTIYKPLSAARHFFRMEAAGGILLVFAALVALAVANSPLYNIYHHFLTETDFAIGLGSLYNFEIRKSVLLWINDGLMAIFFFLVALEIKRELVTGELSSRSRALLPTLAAVGGMAIPAAIYWFINKDSPENLSGWAIPSATDIAFSLGILALLGSRAPVQLKILLTAIAIIDDLGAIVIIALFYGHELNPAALYSAGAIIAALFALNRFKVTKTAPYIILGIILWVAVLKSGVHATLAGVIAAFFIPAASGEKTQHALHPWVAFGILPLFSFANAGVPFDGMGLNSLAEPVTLGIIAGLFIGKQIGIFSTIWLCVKTGISPMLANVTWRQIYGVSILCGIGFTMSLFIGGLAFHDLHHQASIRLGVLTGSLLSAIMGYAILRWPRKSS